MSQRTVRVNELVQRELSEILRRRYQAEAVAITIAEVRIAPDLREGRVFVSIVGDEPYAQERLRWLRRQAPVLREELGRRIVLKYLPKLDYVADRGVARGTRVLRLLDELDASSRPDRARAETDSPED
ncbi:MAG: 30S ribosome-binding factor RbfA [Opitutaceae bacterium]